MTGTIWIAEQGLLASPLCITNTHSVGVVRDAVCRAMPCGSKVPLPWLLPVVAETYDGWLSDADRFPITAEHAFAALDGAVAGPVAEGNVGGGTGMICHEFKGGIGTASRVVARRGGRSRWARWCRRTTARATCCASMACRSGARSAGTSCRRIATCRADARIDHRGAGHRRAAAADPVQAAGPTGDRRASRGSAASVPTAAATSSSPSPPAIACRWPTPVSARSACSRPDQMTPLFQAAAEATEEAILNALTAAETMTGPRGSHRARPAARPACRGGQAIPAVIRREKSAERAVHGDCDDSIRVYQ